MREGRKEKRRILEEKEENHILIRDLQVCTSIFEMFLFCHFIVHIIMYTLSKLVTFSNLTITVKRTLMMLPGYSTVG